MTNKQFSERLNSELDEIGLPQQSAERVEALAKLIKIPRFKAEAILEGNVSVDPPLIKVLAEELEVSEDWLLGKSDKKSS